MLVKEVLAAIDWESLQETATPGWADRTIGGLVGFVVDYAFPAAGLLMFLYLIYGGYKWLTSMGNPQGIANARNHITWAIVGFIVVFMSYWIVVFIGLILGLDRIADIFG